MAAEVDLVRESLEWHSGEVTPWLLPCISFILMSLLSTFIYESYPSHTHTLELLPTQHPWPNQLPSDTVNNRREYILFETLVLYSNLDVAPGLQYNIVSLSNKNSVITNAILSLKNNFGVCTWLVYSGWTQGSDK